MSFELSDIAKLVMDEALVFDKCVCIKYHNMYLFSSDPERSNPRPNGIMTVSKSWAENVNDISPDNSKTFYYGPYSEDFDDHIAELGIEDGIETLLPEGISNLYENQ